MEKIIETIAKIILIGIMTITTIVFSYVIGYQQAQSDITDKALEIATAKGNIPPSDIKYVIMGTSL